MLASTGNHLQPRQGSQQLSKAQLALRWLKNCDGEHFIMCAGWLVGWLVGNGQQQQQQATTNSNNDHQQQQQQQQQQQATTDKQQQQQEQHQLSRAGMLTSAGAAKC
jgi:hypothetical protein